MNQIAKDDDLGNKSIRDLCGMLRVKQAWGLLAASVILLSATFTLGLKIGQNLMPAKAPSMDPIEATQFDNEYQLQLRERQSIATFEKFVKAVAAARWTDAWGCLGADWRSRANADSNLALEFRMTKEIRCKYYIPIQIAPLEERYLIIYEYDDYLPAMPKLMATRQGRLKDVLRPEVLSNLNAELREVFPQCYAPRTVKSKNFQRSLDSLLDNLTLRDVVMNNAIPDKLGQILDWHPIVVDEPRGAGEVGATSEKRTVQLVMTRKSPVENFTVDKFFSETVGNR